MSDPAAAGPRGNGRARRELPRYKWSDTGLTRVECPSRARERSVLGRRDMDGQPERARERERMSQEFRSLDLTPFLILLTSDR
jgi:hypothetical protein